MNQHSPDAELVNTMLDAAIDTVAETTDRPVVHSDRGGHSLARLAGKDERREPHTLDVPQSGLT